MKILTNVDRLEPLGGVELSTLQVSRALAGRGHELEVVFRENGSLRAQFEQFAADLVQIPGFAMRLQSPLGDAARLVPGVRAVQRSDADVVYCHRPEHMLWAVAGGKSSRRARRPVVVHLRHHPSGRTFRALARGVDTFIAVSHFIERQWVDAGVPADKVVVVHNGVDPARYPAGGPDEQVLARTRLSLPPDVPVVLHYGRLVPEKGLGSLLRAWPHVRRQVPEALLVCAGNASPDDASAVPRGWDRADGVVRLPAQDDVTDLLHASDLVVLPAQWQEPFGRVVIEALSSGRPVVASAVGGIPEILTGDLRRLLFPRGDEAALAGKLVENLRWRSTDPGLGLAGRRHVVRHFSLDQTVAAVEAVLHDTVAGDARPVAASATR
ncbi:glycosyltransferase family 4 protein [Kineococcus sp. SYSU DK003]|uniref:glycosyltransferase family 4 protein n=1 Tax=Kineococcus sp. SYSU DK003 TaxID=3383124 RepID=UPI003D7C7B26